MRKENEAIFYSLYMLPTYLVMSQKQLLASEGQLQILEKGEQQPHLLNDALMDRAIKVHTEQNAMLWVPIEQCRKWHEQSPNQEQLVDIDQVESNFKKLIDVNEQIIALAKEIKKGTIDSIMRKSDFEIGLEFVMNYQKYSGKI